MTTDRRGRVVPLATRLRAIRRAVRVLDDVADQVTGYRLWTGEDVVTVAHTALMVEECGARVSRLLATRIRESVASWPQEKQEALQRALDTFSQREEGQT